MPKIAAAIIDTHRGRDMPRRALEQALKIPHCDAVYTFSDQPVLSGETFIKIKPITSIQQYSDLVIYTLPQVITEDYVLVVQWDGLPHAPENWTDAFLAYDYIGAPWPWAPDSLAVGNGGFSLRSRKFLEASLRLPLQRHCGLPAFSNEDVVFCQHYRSMMEYFGVRYATREVAQAFSFEAGIAGTHLGFHGVRNLALFIDERSLVADAREVVDRCYNRTVLATVLIESLGRNLRDFYQALTMEILKTDGLHGEIADIFVKNGQRMPLFTQ